LVFVFGSEIVDIDSQIESKKASPNAFHNVTEKSQEILRFHWIDFVYSDYFLQCQNGTMKAPSIDLHSETITAYLEVNALFKEVFGMKLLHLAGLNNPSEEKHNSVGNRQY